MENAKTILVAEDDDSVRLLLCRVLRDAGYHVLGAENGMDALHQVEYCDGIIHLLVTDVFMPPFFTGTELVRRLRSSLPDMKILYVSAYAADPQVQLAVLDPSADFLPKPFSPIVFAQKVDRILNTDGKRSETEVVEGKETILVRVRDGLEMHWIKDLLQKGGYQVIEVGNRQEAEFVTRWHEGPIHLFLSDRGKGGDSFLQDPELNALKTLRPNMKVAWLGERDGFEFVCKSSGARMQTSGLRRVLDDVAVP